MKFRRPDAFTLIELLAVTAILAVLAAMMLSAMHIVRERGDATRCASNLRQLAAANLAYAADHEGRYVPAQNEANTVRWHGTRAGVLARFDPRRGPLAPYLGESGKVKLCPALQRVLKGADTFEEGTGGYGYNAVYLGGVPGKPFSPEFLANVPRPTGTLMFADCALPRSNGLQEYAYAEPWEWVDYAGRLRGALSPSVHFRHGQLANVAWADGHVSAEPAARLGNTNIYGGDARKHRVGWLGLPGENGVWNPRRTFP